MHCKQWIFDMDGTLTDSMTVVWEGAPDALLRRYGRTPRGDLRATLLNMGMQEGAQYLIREYGLPLTEESYFSVMREVIAQLYEKVELKPGVRDTLARLRAEGARMSSRSPEAIQDAFYSWYDGLTDNQQEGFAEAWPLVKDAALDLLSDKDSMTGRIADAGLDADTLPGCTLKNWQALQSVLDDIVPETNGEA